MASAMDTDSIVDAGRSECDESVTKGHNEVDLEFPNKYLISAEDNSTNPLWTSPIQLNIALKNSVFSEALMNKPQINKAMSNKIKTVILHTGNILENEDLVRKVGHTTLEELRECVKVTLNNWKNDDLLEDENVITIRGVWNRAPHLETPDGLKTTVKVFLSKNLEEDMEDAIRTSLRELRLVNINTVIVIPPDVSDELTLTELKPVWQALESAIINGKVSHIGIADLSPSLFKELYYFAKIKPSIIQINLSSCCTIPEELTKFAASHEIQVLTHNDDTEVIDHESISTIINKVGLTGSQWEVQWIARHRSIETCYGLVNAKGYTISLTLNK